MYTLIYDESGEPRRHALSLGDTVIGRMASCDLVLADASVSRRHARLTVNDTGCVVTDFDSRNGTFVNGDQISTSPLSDGDRLILGRVPIQIEYSEAERLALSEHHVLIDLPGTVLRPIAQGTVAGTSTADAGRLLQLLSEIARTLVKNQPIGDVLNRVVELAFETVRAERAFLLLNEPGSVTPVPRVVRCRDASEMKAATVSRTIVNRAMTERVAMLATDAQFDPRLGGAESIQAQHVRSFMCAPLWNQNEVIGILYVDTPRSKKFAAADLDLFTALSNYAAVAIEQARLSARVIEETRYRERLQRYHSPAVVDRILQGGVGGEAPFLVQERDLTVLFVDIVGFTTLSEGLPPQQIALLLNSFFARMTDVIFEHGGTLDKFIGDAILAVFGAPLDHPDHARRGVQAAVAMRQALARFNADRAAAPLQIRIALHSGMAVAGDIGSPKRREYTVLGDVVNIASRIESTVAQPGQILISRDTYDRLNGEIAASSLGTVSLRGRVGQVEVFEVQG